MAACCSGAGGISRNNACTNSSSESNLSAVLWRRSNPTVDTGVALRPPGGPFQNAEALRPRAEKIIAALAGA